MCKAGFLDDREGVLNTTSDDVTSRKEVEFVEAFWNFKKLAES